MDLHKTIRHLREERKRLDETIARLEAMQASGESAKPAAPPKRRGRKTMGIEERLDVSERMKRYWAAKKARAAATS